MIVSAQNQSNERLIATESRSNTIASTSNNARSLIGNVLNTSNSTFRHSSKAPLDDFDGNETAKAEPNNDVDDDDLALMLEPNLRPPPPDLRSDLSKQIFEEHKQLAKEYLKVSFSKIPV